MHSSPEIRPSTGSKNGKANGERRSKAVVGLDTDGGMEGDVKFRPKGTTGERLSSRVMVGELG